MHASTPTRATGMALATAVLVLTSGLAGAKLPAPTEEQRAQADLAKAKVTWGDKAAAFQMCRAQDKAAVSYRAGDKVTHTQPDAPCVDPGLFVAPVSAASAPAPAIRG